MPKLMGRAAKVMSNDFCVGVLFDWQAEYKFENTFELTAQSYFLDQASRGRGQPVRIELFMGPVKFVGGAQIISQVAFDQLIKEPITFKGVEKLCHRKRKLRKTS